MIPRIAIVGEYRGDNFSPQTSIITAFDFLQKERSFQFDWISTQEVEAADESLLSKYSGFFSAPGSPFNSLAGAVAAIHFARIHRIPHLGTCAGFQHGVIELARNLLGFPDAQHEEYITQASFMFIHRLACSLAGQRMQVRILSPSLTFNIYDATDVLEDYYCNFGLNPDFVKALNHPSITIAGTDQEKEIRIIELVDHPFFILTLFVPQTRWIETRPHPLIEAFVNAVCDRASSGRGTGA